MVVGLHYEGILGKQQEINSTDTSSMIRLKRCLLKEDGFTQLIPDKGVKQKHVKQGNPSLSMMVD